MRHADGSFSKTMLFNIVFLVLGLAMPILDFFGYGDYVPAEWVSGLLIALVPIVNLILRYFFTRESLRR